MTNESTVKRKTGITEAKTASAAVLERQGGHMGMREEPDGFGLDPMGEFLVRAQENGYAAYVNLRGPYEKLSKIDGLFRKALDHLDHSKDWLPVLFLLRSHSAYLGAARLALSGQLAEAYIVLRGGLESALYGFRLYKKPHLAGPWLKRNDDQATERQVREEFSWGNVRRELEAQSPRLAGIANTLYLRTLDLGAHPNSGAFLQSLTISEEGHNHRLELNYLTVESTAHHLALKSTAQVGTLSLLIFEQIFKERFELIELNQEIDAEASIL